MFSQLRVCLSTRSPPRHVAASEPPSPPSKLTDGKAYLGLPVGMFGLFGVFGQFLRSLASEIAGRLGAATLPRPGRTRRI